jgi:hypothetical protein
MNRHEAVNEPNHPVDTNYGGTDRRAATAQWWFRDAQVNLPEEQIDKIVIQEKVTPGLLKGVTYPEHPLLKDCGIEAAGDRHRLANFARCLNFGENTQPPTQNQQGPLPQNSTATNNIEIPQEHLSAIVAAVNHLNPDQNQGPNSFDDAKNLVLNLAQEIIRNSGSGHLINKQAKFKGWFLNRFGLDFSSVEPDVAAVRLILHIQSNGDYIQPSTIKSWLESMIACFDRDGTIHRLKPDTARAVKSFISHYSSLAYKALKQQPEDITSGYPPITREDVCHLTHCCLKKNAGTLTSPDLQNLAILSLG